MDTREADTGGEDDKDGHEEARDGNEEVLLHDHLLDCIINLTKVGGVLLEAVKTKGVVEGDGHIQGNLLRGGPNRGGEDDVAAALEGRDAAEPARGSWSADDNVGPSHLEAAQDHRGKNCHDRFGDQRTGGEADEDAKEKVVDNVGNNSDLKTTEARPWACFFTEMADGCADSRSDGFGFDEEEFRLRGGGLFRGFLVGRQKRSISLIRFGRLDCKSSGSRCLNHGKSCYNSAIDVADLFVGSVFKAQGD